jgi:hypothetical protein
MPSSTTKLAESMSYDAVRAIPFTQIHRRPTRHDYKTLKKEAANLASKMDNLTFAWSPEPTNSKEYGLLAKIIGADEYTHLTNQTWVQEVEPASYNPAITDATVTHMRKGMEEEWEKKRESWYIQKGFLRGVVMNMRDALDKQYYSQLKHVITAYRNTTAIQILDHLNTRWRPLDVQAQKIPKKEFYTDWDTSNMHPTAFGMKLDKDQNCLNRLGIVISNEDKLQFYLKQIYASNYFDKAEMVAWENKPILIKDDYDKAKRYFETLVKDFKTYTQNSGGTVGKAGYNSPNQVADMGDEIQKYIQEIASATVADKAKTAELAANISEVTKAKDAQINSITAQIKLLTDTVALLSKSIANKENIGSNSSGGSSSGSGSSGSGGGGLGGGHDFRYTRNMGNYCWSCGHHPVGMKPNSITCTHKKDRHKDGATATNCMGGENFRPRKYKIKPSQQEHASYKGKSAPN